MWFLARDRKNGTFRDRRGGLLFIDARKLGRMVDHSHRELTDEDLARIIDTYHAWRQTVGADPCVCPSAWQTHRSAPTYSDVPGF